jgi:hypothetical protein
VAETDGSAAWIGIDLGLARPPEEEIHLMDSRNWTYPPEGRFPPRFQSYTTSCE